MFGDHTGLQKKFKVLYVNTVSVVFNFCLDLSDSQDKIVKCGQLQDRLRIKTRTPTPRMTSIKVSGGLLQVSCYLCYKTAYSEAWESQSPWKLSNTSAHCSLNPDEGITFHGHQSLGTETPDAKFCDACRSSFQLQSQHQILENDRKLHGIEMKGTRSGVFHNNGLILKVSATNLKGSYDKWWLKLI